MDSDLYRAVQSGSWEAIKKLPPTVYSQTTASGNTILHVLAQYSCDSPEDAVEWMLSQDPDMGLKKNRERETPLIIASRRGHSSIVRALIHHFKSNDDQLKTVVGNSKRLKALLEAVDRNGNSALHEAVSNDWLEIADLLLDAAPAQGFVYGQNAAEESPLYMAVENGNFEMLKSILDRPNYSFYGPRMNTVLHAAAMRNSTPECVEMIINKIKKPSITRVVNETGWTALHYAAKYDHLELVKLLLSRDKSMGYVAAIFPKSETALHVAVIHGHLDVVREILSHCPDSWDMVTVKSNILHLAVENEHQEIMEFILNQSWAFELINQQDLKGNTPIHLYVLTKDLIGHNLVNHQFVDWIVFNLDGLTPLSMIKHKYGGVPPTRQKSIRDELLNAGAKLELRIRKGIVRSTVELKKDDAETLDTYILVATLIITVSFAAGFTVPGGYDTRKGKEGMAILSKKAAFYGFVVSDSLALLFATSSVVLQLAARENFPCFIPAILIRLVLALNNKNLDRLGESDKKPSQMLEKWVLLRYSKIFIIFAMAMLLIAFTTGLYAVLSALALKIILVLYGSNFCCILVFALFSAVPGWKKVLEDSDDEDMFESNV